MFEQHVINTIMMMYAQGVPVYEISDYIGVIPMDVNEIIDNYNDCLNMEE